jgi:hypothetical protein
MPFTDAGAARHAAAQLRDAIDKALLIGAPVHILRTRRTESRHCRRRFTATDPRIRPVVEVFLEAAASGGQFWPRMR